MALVTATIQNTVTGSDPAPRSIDSEINGSSRPSIRTSEPDRGLRPRSGRELRNEAQARMSSTRPAKRTSTRRRPPGRTITRDVRVGEQHPSAGAPPARPAMNPRIPPDRRAGGIGWRWTLRGPEVQRSNAVASAMTSGQASAAVTPEAAKISSAWYISDAASPLPTFSPTEIYVTGADRPANLAGHSGEPGEDGRTRTSIPVSRANQASPQGQDQAANESPEHMARFLRSAPVRSEHDVQTLTKRIARRRPRRTYGTSSRSHAP